MGIGEQFELEKTGRIEPESGPVDSIVSITVKDIVKEYLIANGYGGLFNENAPCGCELDDLIPCDGECDKCSPGYKHMDPRTDHKGEFAIWEKKEMPDDDEWENLEY